MLKSSLCRNWLIFTAGETTSFLPEVASRFSGVLHHMPTGLSVMSYFTRRLLMQWTVHSADWSASTWILPNRRKSRMLLPRRGTLRSAFSRAHLLLLLSLTAGTD